MQSTVVTFRPRVPAGGGKSDAVDGDRDEHRATRPHSRVVRPGTTKDGSIVVPGDYLEVVIHPPMTE